MAVCFIILLAFLAFYDLRLLTDGMNLSAFRYNAINDLKLMAKGQKEYFKKHGKYAASFKDLGYGLDPSQKWINSRYSFYMNGDSIWPGNLPSYKTEIYPVTIDDKHIYAACSINKLGRDAISINYNGQIEIIESFDFWPLPYPKGARKYKGPK